jgi:hypothetical protein
MRAIAPRTGAPEVTFAEEQEEYKPITVACYRDDDGLGILLTRWTLTEAEREAVAGGEDIYVGQLNFGGPMTPLIVRCGPGDFANATEPA